MDLTFERRSITTAAADRLIEAATAEAERIGRPFTIAVVDDAGTLKAFRRMDGARQSSVAIAQDKAFTSATLGQATGDFYEFIREDPPLLAGAPAAMDRLVLMAGGLPLRVDGQVVGGIGVSGSHYSEDLKVAQAAVAALGLDSD